MMLIRDQDWQRVREHFSLQEKCVLRAAMTGETICPPGVVIDEAKAGEVGTKLKNLLQKEPSHDGDSTEFHD